MADEIVWLNHAGYELRTGDVRIVHDPWLSGTAFDDGWALVSKSAHGPGDFAGVDYLWFSHEHPDHFSPSLLRAIPEEVRRTITVLFQRTRDGRVAAFCRGLGFPVRELGDGERVALRSGVFVTCGVLGDDSWMFTETPERTYFNPNDAVARDWAPIAATFARPVDVLLTQFSYAFGAGAPGESTRMRAAADEQLALMDAQIAAVGPRWVIPFASFIWFCRAENFHLNEGANRIEAVYERLRARVETVVLYPGDRWRVGEARDSAGAVSRYMADWAGHAAPLPARAPVPVADLERLARAYRERLARDNALWLVRPFARAGLVRPVAMWLADLGEGVRFDGLGGGVIARGLGVQACELELASTSLANMLRHNSGMGTLMVNGCYRELRPGGLRRLSRHFAIAGHNARGDRLPDALLRPTYVLDQGRRVLAAVGR